MSYQLRMLHSIDCDGNRVLGIIVTGDVEGRSRSIYQIPIAALDWRYRGHERKTSVRVISNSAEMRTRYIPNTNL